MIRIAWVLLLAWPLAAPAQPKGAIDTDGPDFVESTEVVGRGHWQFETGPYLQDDARNPPARRLGSTPLLLKFGTSDDIELRLETDGRIRASDSVPAGTPADVQRGSADTAIGFKWHSHDRRPELGGPAVAWIAHVELPSGSSGQRGSGLRPSLRSVIGWDLPYGMSLGLMPGIKLDTRPDGSRFTSGILGTVLGKWWSDSFRTFIESSAVQVAHKEIRRRHFVQRYRRGVAGRSLVAGRRTRRLGGQSQYAEPIPADLGRCAILVRLALSDR